MDLNIEQSFNPRVITPYSFKGRTYYLMFHTAKVAGPFYVCDSAVQVEHSMLTFGDIKRKVDDSIVGTLLFTSANSKCLGTYLLVYSGQFKATVDATLPKDFDMDLVLKTQFLQVYTKRNRATLVVSPNLKDSIKQNLEV